MLTSSSISGDQSERLGLLLFFICPAVRRDFDDGKIMGPAGVRGYTGY